MLVTILNSEVVVFLRTQCITEILVKLRTEGKWSYFRDGCKAGLYGISKYHNSFVFRFISLCTRWSTLYHPMGGPERGDTHEHPSFWTPSYSLHKIY